ncbi:MAG TPA: cupredoxin domain-containing protein [Candidatus Dojkabacteria bacterium]|jgi:plastocyanin
MKKRVFILLPVISILILTGCTTSNTVTNNDTSDSQDNRNQNDSSSEDSVEVDYTIEMSDHKFSITEIKASPGDSITIELKGGQGIHDFVLDEFSVTSRLLSSGDSQIITIDIPSNASGEYEFYCSVSNHRQLGMVGTLIIE